ncbi:ABC transporter ATP-binding protein [Halobacillus salinus]|uniref:ABC transporter ATP-binding protein n=1 Tax=Halobacillus salinus TaxID=192814 RepID=UPI0009A87B52|nr:ABC transporter ATP-binding protein [Halobacillus salinus]
MNITEIFRAMSYVHKIGKTWVYLSVFFTILLGLLPVSILIVTKDLVNEVSNLITNTGSDYTSSLILLITLFIMMTVNSIIKHIQSYLDNKIQVKLDHNLKYKISEKLSKIPYSKYDDTDFHHHLNRIQGNQGQKFLSPLDNVFIIIQSFITSISLIWFLVSIHWSLAIISLISGLPILVVKSVFGNKSFWLSLLQTPRAREANYIQRLFLNREYAKEIRLFNLENYFISRWSRKYLKNAEESLNLLRRQKFSFIGLDSMSALFYALSAGIIIWLIKRSTVSIGEFVAIGQAVQETQNSINNMATSSAQIYENSLYIKDYFSFLDYEEEVYNGKSFPKLNEGIMINDLSFSYPLSNKKVINNINISFKAGERIAIVGDNGSGKTTLIKCLLGLYKPNKGEIFFDNVPIQQINKTSLRDNFSVIFQDYLKYSFTVRENIQLGDIKRKFQKEDLYKVTKKSGADKFINNLPEGYETYLGKQLRIGEDLSGGQWQKIALARALYKNDSQVLIFDEPTSSLDPISEIAAFNSICEQTKDKTLIFISHRMAATTLADKIIVLKDGEVVESGTHDKLMSNYGIYYNMFKKQSDWFNENSNGVESFV